MTLLKTSLAESRDAKLYGVALNFIALSSSSVTCFRASSMHLFMVVPHDLNSLKLRSTPGMLGILVFDAAFGAPTPRLRSY
jgi:hypothetical protein